MAALMIRDGFYTDDEAKSSAIKTTMTAVLWLYDEPERLAILREIRETMTQGERSRLNSPISARQRVEKILRAREHGTEEKQKDSPVTLLKRKVAELERELATAQAKLARKDDGSLFDLKQTPPAEMAFVFTENVSEGRWRDIKRAIDEHYKRKKRKPAG
jgi:hypothetical protein